MANIDLKKVYKESYSAKVGKPALVEIPARPFLMIDGAGDPNGDEYAEAIAALYPIAYGLRFLLKDQTGDAYTVMPLEGLWWADDMETFSEERKGDWKWTAMIAVPEVATPELVATVIDETTEKKGQSSLDRVRFDVFEEGLSAQVMHIGPYSAEAPTIEMLHQFIADQGKALRGLHHEIYLGDPRRSAPEKLKTIIRQPVT
jgi:hypothetical protein